MPPTEQSHIIISEQTENSISCISNKLTEWIPDNMTVVILSPEDLEDLDNFYASLPEEIRDHFSKDDFGNLRHRGACCSTRDIDGNGINDIGYILTPSISATKESIATGYANIPAENLTLPGSDGEWRAAVTTHEIGHLDQKKGLVKGRLSRLGGEMEADQNSIDYFSQINIAVAQARLECRILGAFTGGTAFQNSHITSAGVAIKPDDHVPNLNELTRTQHEEIYNEILDDAEEIDILTAEDKHEFQSALKENRQITPSILSDNAKQYWEDKCRYAYATQYSDGLRAARHTAYYKLGVQNLECIDSHGEYIIPLSFKKEILISTRPGNIKLQNANVEPEDQEVINKIIQDELSFDDGLALLSPELVRNYHYSLENMVSNIGRNIARESPDALYEATAELYVSGGFSENAIGEQYAWEFLEAGQKLAPLHFNLPENAQPFTPPSHNNEGPNNASGIQPFQGITHTLPLSPK